MVSIKNIIREVAKKAAEATVEVAKAPVTIARAAAAEAREARTGTEFEQNDSITQAQQEQKAREQAAAQAELDGGGFTVSVGANGEVVCGTGDVGGIDREAQPVKAAPIWEKFLENQKRLQREKEVDSGGGTVTTMAYPSDSDAITGPTFPVDGDGNGMVTTMAYPSDSDAITGPVFPIDGNDRVKVGIDPKPDWMKDPVRVGIDPKPGWLEERERAQREREPIRVAIDPRPEWLDKKRIAPKVREIIEKRVEDKKRKDPKVPSEPRSDITTMRYPSDNEDGGTGGGFGAI